MLNLIILFISMIVVIGIFGGAICLQLHISKNNKRGKFAIPIIMFLMPIIMGLFIVVIGLVPIYNHKVSSDTVIESQTSQVILDENGEIIEGEPNIVTVEGSAEASYVAGVIIFPMLMASVLGFPCAIITLIIELVYRSKRKKITDQDVIDIQNL